MLMYPLLIDRAVRSPQHSLARTTMTQLQHNTYNNNLQVMNQGHEIDHPVFSLTSQLYNNDLHYNMDPNFVPYHNFSQRTAHEQSYTAEFGTAQIYHDAPGYSQGSPSLHPQHAGSPELHNGPFNSSLSSASGQSASSSNVSSPYSNHATIAPPVTPWPQHGLRIQQPGIAGDDYGYNYGGFGGSSIEQQEFNFADVQKPIGFVGECANVSASWSSFQPPVMSTPNSTMGSLVAEHNAISSITTSAMQQVSNMMRPQPMSPPSLRRVNHAAFPVVSDSCASHSSIAFSPRAKGLGSQSAGRSDASSAAQHFKFPAPASPFFNQSSGRFLPPFTCPGSFLLSLSYCRAHSIASQLLIT